MSDLPCQLQWAGDRPSPGTSAESSAMGRRDKSEPVCIPDAATLSILHICFKLEVWLRGLK